jgi:hypothetical protein
MNFREAAGKQLQWENTSFESGFSNFLFVDRHYASDPVMRRIFSLARKHNYKSAVIDEISESNCALLAEENDALRIRRPDFQKSSVHRISFFLSPRGQPPGQSDFVGYVVFKQDFFANDPKPRSHVFESVMKPCRGVAQNNFIHCWQEYEVRTSVGEFRVGGVLYAQQNDLTFVCAHVGLRSTLALILPEGDVTYARLNGLLGIDHKSRTLGGGSGLKPDDIETVLTQLGVSFEKIVHEPSQALLLPTEFQRDLYGFIESGFPALVGFELDKTNPGPAGAPRHIIPVFGHTFNEDTWLPDAQRAYFGGTLSYYPSENWLSTFVVHDDNFGPYLCLPRHFLKKDNFRVMYGLKRAGTPFGAVEAEAVGFDYLRAIATRFPANGTDWYDRFVVFTKCGWLVLRTVLVSRDLYLTDLRAATSRSGVTLEQEHTDKLRNSLPDSFWMVEASAPELFGVSRRKFGEVLISAQKPLPKPLNVSLLLAARLPGLLMIGGGGKPFAVEKTKFDGHSPLFALVHL